MSVDQHIESHLGCKVSDKKIISTGETSSFKILTSTGLSIFAKYQDIENNNLINQANELVLLSENMNTPKVLGFSKNCLLLEWIETSHNSNHQAEIGKVLANLHKRTNQYFGFNYDNTYFDTHNFLFYTQHHNEHRQRFKVRFRKYSSSSKSFFEIKIKNNKNRTVKTRMLVNEMNEVLGEKEKNLVSEIIGLPPNQLSPMLNIQFTRITLADHSFSERLTIDTNLSVKNGTGSKIFNQLVISEIKQEKYNPKSDFIQILRNLKIPK